MPEKLTYLFIELLCIILPFAFSFHPKISFYKQWRYFLAPCFISALFFLIWDMLFTFQGIWSFNTKYISGIYLINLPIEECLFFLCIPYACVFTYYCIKLFFNLSRYKTAARNLTWLLALFLLIGALFYVAQLYTSLTFLFLGCLLIFIVLKKKSFLPYYYFTFSIILIPFFISNGILTGTSLSQPIVLYNNNYNSAIRILTVPVEDIFYGMLLLLMNITGFEYLANKHESLNRLDTIQ